MNIKINILKRVSPGQASLEMALILPVFFAIFLGFIEWGMYFYTRTTMDVAAYDAVRMAVTFDDWPANQTSRENEVRAEFLNRSDFIPDGVISNINSNINIQFDSDINNIEFITVNTNSLTYKGISGFGGVFYLPNSISSEARVRYERY